MAAPRSLWGWASAAHLALLLALIVLFRTVGERSAAVALLLYMPRVFFGLPAVLLALALALRGPRKLLIIPAAAALVTVGPLMGFHLNLPGPAASSIRLLTYNVWFGYRDPAAIAEEVRAAAPDVVLFQAAAHAADVALKAPPFEKFHYLHHADFVIASRYPVRWVSQGESYTARLGPAWVRFAVDTPIGMLDLFSVHPHSPRSFFQQFRKRGLASLRPGGPPLDPDGTLPFLERQLRQIDAASRDAGPLLAIAGDFNAPEGGALLRDLLARHDDAFAAAGQGFGYTFPVAGPLPRWLRLDRVLLGSGLYAAGARVVGGRGSDHAALLVEIAAR